MRSIRKRRKKNKSGRPSLYSPEIEAEICGYIERGVPPSRATVLAGLTERTYTRWNAGNEAFCLAVKRAEGRFILRGVTAIQIAAQKPERKIQWTPWAWLLERRFPDVFGRVDRHHIKAETDGHMPMPQEYIAAINRALGITGRLIPIKRPPDRVMELPALPQGEASPDSELPILPQDDYPIQ